MPSEIAAQNAHHGLNVFVVLHHQTPGLTPDDQIQVRARLTAAFLEDMRGYRLREVLADGLEDELADWAIPVGSAFETCTTIGIAHTSNPGPGGRCSA